ncbi:unnamed protein product [Haemonchus placei]|uniref:FCP1 homology domain-containing protein n=1 Tax=Haemonchus placei TaxID=6290 RepID=A0A0N4VW43_HAEPC|nr:unnamed protein product [Haemonchus placei]
MTILVLDNLPDLHSYSHSRGPDRVDVAASMPAVVHAFQMACTRMDEVMMKHLKS